MILEVYLLLFATAIIATAVVLWIGTTGEIGSSSVNSRIGILISAVTFLLWGLVAIESFEITVTSGGEEFVRSYEQLAWVAVGGSGIALISMIQASLEEIKDTGGI